MMHNFLKRVYKYLLIAGLVTFAPISLADEEGERVWFKHPKDGLIMVSTDIEKDRFRLWSNCEAM